MRNSLLKNKKKEKLKCLWLCPCVEMWLFNWMINDINTYHYMLGYVNFRWATKEADKV